MKHQPNARREYRVSDEARDVKLKTYGSQQWKRADGAVEEEWRTGRPLKSKLCDFSRYGFVAAGPGQGEVFRVCINKEKCKVHWPEHVKRAEQRKKRAKPQSVTGQSAATPDRSEREEARRRAETELEEAERARWKKALPELRAALAEKIRTAPTGPTGILGAAVLEECQGFYWENGWAKKIMPLGRTAEDVVRRAAWLVLTKNLNEHRAISTCGALFKKFGLDAAAIVDQVAPKPTSKKKQTAKVGKKK